MEINFKYIKRLIKFLHNIPHKFNILFCTTKIQSVFLLNVIHFKRSIVTFSSQFLTSVELANQIFVQEILSKWKIFLSPEVLYHLLEPWKQMENIYQPIIFSSLPFPNV